MTLTELEAERKRLVARVAELEAANAKLVARDQEWWRAACGVLNEQAFPDEAAERQAWADLNDLKLGSAWSDVPEPMAKILCEQRDKAYTRIAELEAENERLKAVKWSINRHSIIMVDTQMNTPQASTVKCPLCERRVAVCRYEGDDRPRYRTHNCGSGPRMGRECDNSDQLVPTRVLEDDE